jgi:hypothetical protein
MAEFDPLGLVKAMGPQRDPYSWAELYATDASKHQLAQEEIKNRLLIQEMTRAERAKESALDRAHTGKIAREREAGADRRTAARIGAIGGTRGGSDNVVLPKGTITPDDFRARRKMDPSKFTPVRIGKDVYYIPDDQMPAFKLPRATVGAPAAGTAAPARPAPVEDDDEDVLNP